MAGETFPPPPEAAKDGEPATEALSPPVPEGWVEPKRQVGRS